MLKVILIKSQNWDWNIDILTILNNHISSTGALREELHLFKLAQSTWAPRGSVIGRTVAGGGVYVCMLMFVKCG